MQLLRVFLCISFPLILMGTTLDFRISTCNLAVVNHISRLISDHPESLLIPLGRAYIADKYGLALILDTSSTRNMTPNHKSMSETDAFYVYTNTIVKLIITMCKLPSTMTSLSFYKTKGGVIDDVCFISLDSRIVGKEILHVNSEVVHTQYRNTSDFLPCYWHLSFEHEFFFHGDYKLVLHTSWIHEFDEPTAAERNRGKTSRANDGIAKNLNGLGLHQYYVLNASREKLDLSGYILRGDSPSLYLITANNTKHEFQDAQTFLALGYAFGVEKKVSQGFLNSLPTGFPLQLSDITNVSSFKASLPRPNTIPDSSFLLLDTQTLKNFDCAFCLNESMVFDLPPKIVVVNHPLARYKNGISNYADYMKAYNELPVCRGGDDRGRWVHDAYCEEGTNKWSKIDGGGGNECAEGYPPWHMSEGAYDFPLRSRDMIWTPYSCRLGSLHHRAAIDSSLDYCGNVKNLLRRTRNYTGSSDLEIAAAKRNNVTIETSVLKYCLKESGVGFVSGFGDSLGDELRDYFFFILGQGVPWYADRGIKCGHVQALAQVDELISCINASVYQLNFTDNRYPVRQIVLATNFRMQHSTAGLSIEVVEELLKRHAARHKELETHLKTAFNIRYRRIYYSAIAIHGFRLGGLTPLRQSHVNKFARDVLGPTGWEVLDAYNMTVGRPDGTWDTTHYRGGVAIAIAHVFANMLCTSDCRP